MIIALSVYAGKFNNEATGPVDYSYSWSFALGWVGAVLYLLAAAVYGVGAFFVLKNVGIRKYESIKHWTTCN